MPGVLKSFIFSKEYQTFNALTHFALQTATRSVNAAANITMRQADKLLDNNPSQLLNGSAFGVDFL